MALFGNRIARSEDERLLTGRGRYVSNQPDDSDLHVAFVRSSYAHALITSIDVDAARLAPGVVAVYTGKDAAFNVTPIAMLAPGMVPETMLRPALTHERARFVGEPIAMVVADSPNAAADAAALVEVDFDPLPAVMTVEAALSDSVLLHPGAATNTMMAIPASSSGALEGAQVVVEGSFEFPRIAAVPLEGHSMRATWDGTILTLHLSAQGTTFPQLILANALGLDPSAMRIVIRDVGGAFGAKALMTPEEVLVVWAAMQLTATVRWAETRSENLVAMSHGRGQQARVALAATKEGTFTGLSIELVQQAGAYPDGAMMLPNFTRAMAAGPYVIPKIDWSSKCVATNATPVSAFRGAGRPEATFFLERIIDKLAKHLDVDPLELRRRNLIPSDAFPYTTQMGTTYDSGNYTEALDRLEKLADYERLRSEQRSRIGAGDHVCLGIGVSVYVESTNPQGSSDSTDLELQPDGTFVLTTPATPYGQGLETTFAQVAAHRLGVPFEQVRVRHGDTTFTPSPGTGGSKSTQTWGVLADRSAVALIEAAREVAANWLEAAVDDIVFDGDSGVFHVAGTPAASVSWGVLAQEIGGGGLRVTESAEFHPTYPFGAHMCVVEVDSETGGVTLRDVYAVDDCGRVVNPMLVEGQIHGGLAQGCGFALTEAILYDEDGNPNTSTLAEYGFPSAAEFPSFTLESMETPAPGNELGMKGAGEAGALGSTCATANAVVDALSHLGVTEIAIPVSPERVWRSVRDAAAI